MVFSVPKRSVQLEVLDVGKDSKWHRERMRLLTIAAFDRGKGEDTFGMNDEDWQLYKRMSKDHDDDDDDGADDDEAELACLNERLQEIGSTFTFTAIDTVATQPVAEVQWPRLLTAEDFRIMIGVERFQCLESLFQPHIFGVNQAGIDEMIGSWFKDYLLRVQIKL